MLKTRIIGVVLVRDGIAVQSIGFSRYLPIGHPSVAIDYLNRWGIDEVVILDISASLQNRAPDVSMVKHCSRFAQMPLAAGGGIREITHITDLIRSGADKVVINAAAAKNPRFIEKAADIFGDQCIVVSIDARRMPDGSYVTYTHSGTLPTGISPAECAKVAEKHGAGEILLNSIDRDGAKSGFDYELIRSVFDSISIPLIACGGAGHPLHLKQAMEFKVSGVAAANFFHFAEHAVIISKRYLEQEREEIRLETYASYPDSRFNPDGRLMKKDDERLQKLRFELIPEEKI